MNIKFSKIKVLVIDDEVGQLGKTARKLIQIGFREENIIQKKEAKRLARQLKNFDFSDFKKIDIIICDSRMPRISGMEFFKTMEEAGKSKKILFVLRLGNNENDAREEAKKVGIENFILKSDLDSLGRVILEAFRNFKIGLP